MSDKHVFNIEIFEDQKAGVLIGTSTDIVGLTLEAETMGGLYDAIFDIAPQLLKENLGISKDEDIHVALHTRGELKNKPHIPFRSFSLEESIA